MVERLAVWYLVLLLDAGLVEVRHVVKFFHQKIVVLGVLFVCPLINYLRAALRPSDRLEFLELKGMGISLILLLDSREVAHPHEGPEPEL